MAHRPAHYFDGLFESHRLGDGTNAMPVWACMDPGGAVVLSTLRSSADESIRACFGTNPDQSHIDNMARQGWRCLPMTLVSNASTPTVYVNATAPEDGRLPDAQAVPNGGLFLNPEAAQKAAAKEIKRSETSYLASYRAKLVFVEQIEPTTPAAAA